MAKRGPMVMYMNKKQTFSTLNGSYLDESDAGSTKVLLVKRSRSNFVHKHDASYLHFEFIATDDTGVPKLQCVVCGIETSNDSMKPLNL